MSKRISEINLVLGTPAEGLLVTKVWLEKAGDLYVHRGAPEIMAGKYSYHASGLTHQDVFVIKQRTGLGQPRRQSLSDVRRIERIVSWGSPEPGEPNGYQARADTKVRRTAVHSLPSKGWLVGVWALAPGRRDLAERIADTDPFPTVKAATSVLADWGTPWLLVTFAEWTDDAPYTVVRYAPALPGRVPFHMTPDPYEGTWLEASGPKWRPGQPFPKQWIDRSREWQARQRKNEARGILHDRPL